VFFWFYLSFEGVVLTVVAVELRDAANPL